MARGLTPGLNPTAAGLRPLPGHSGTPGLGFVGRYFSDQLGWARDTYDRHGPISWTKGLGQPIFVALGPEATGVVLTNSDKAFANGPGWDFLIGPFFKRGIMLLDFAEHLYHRRIMQQAFTRDRLNTYLVAMNPGIAHGLNTWAPGPSFTLYPAIKRLTLDLAAQTFLGGDLGADTQRINKAFVASVQGGEAYLRFPVPGLTWSRGLAGRRYLEGRFRAQLPAKRASDVSTNADLFSALCHAVSENGERFTDDDVVNHIIFLMLAAHDTTTTTLATMAYYLAKHPDWQRRCRAETLALGKPAISFDDLDALPSIELVMKEALRLNAPVPHLVRKTVKDTEVLGHDVPAGMYTLVLPHFVHHMPEYWPDPGRFDPERFTEARREDRAHRNIWIPFGGGVHKCIGLHFAGMQVKAILHQLLYRFEWSVDPSYEVPWRRKSLPVPTDGLPIDLRRVRH